MNQEVTYLYHKQNALATAGTLMPEFKNAEKWMNTGYQILSEEVQNQIMSDGWHNGNVSSTIISVSLRISTRQ